MINDEAHTRPLSIGGPYFSVGSSDKLSIQPFVSLRFWDNARKFENVSTGVLDVDGDRQDMELKYFPTRYFGRFAVTRFVEKGSPTGQAGLSNYGSANNAFYVVRQLCLFWQTRLHDFKSPFTAR